ncbi:metal-dependent hydrolase family protein [Kordiimonas pumila]|uniref:Amidohydrolase family protein n=1 Tax=Kordiimonas pumila TaxID=2161677 RepID=A0ABV7D5U4_9PROT|nr:amidohydrolase family protein [Kordiimonas pumila]
MKFIKYLGVCACLMFAGQAVCAADDTIYLQVGRVLADPENGKVLEDKTIVVTDGKITSIEDGFVGEGTVIDLKDKFILPGFMDSHVHLYGVAGKSDELDAFKKTDSDYTFDAMLNGQKTLRAGFTTVADLGGPTEAIYALRDAIKAGKVQGPHIIASGGVGVHGGHGDINGFIPDVIAAFRSPLVCTGADKCAQSVRMAIQNGADVIKIASTGGVMSNTATGVGQQMTDAELEAIVTTAHRLGRQVACHAHGTDGINAAVKAGVDSIEHGSYLDGESIKLMKKNGTYLVPTLLAGATVTLAAAESDWMPDAVRAKAKTVGPIMVAAASRAREGGVKFAFGTDSGVSEHGDNGKEFALMVKAGFSPLDTIRSATVWAAKHLGVDAQSGSLVAGKVADLVAVNGNPLEDVTVLEKMAFVMKSGAVVPMED